MLNLSEIQCWLDIFDIILLESVLRCQAVLAEFEKRKAAMLALQSGTRPWIVIRGLRKQNEASTSIQAMWRENAAYWLHQRKLESAAVGQSACHGLLTCKQIQGLGTNAVTLQSAWRHYLAM